MSKSATTVFRYGIYVFFLGLWTLFAQHLVMPLMWMEAWADHRVYIVWVFAVALSYYYISSAKAENTHFFKISVHGRTRFFVATTVLALLWIAPMMMIVIATVDLAWAIWTQMSFNK